MKVHKPTWQLAISFLWPWCPSLQLLLYCWSHFWTSEDLPQHCSRQIFDNLFCLKKKKGNWRLSKATSKLYMIILKFQGIFKYSWTSPKWSPYGQKKVVVVKRWDISSFGHHIAEYWLTLSANTLSTYQSNICQHVSHVSVDMSVYISRLSVSRHVSQYLGR